MAGCLFPFFAKQTNNMLCNFFVNGVIYSLCLWRILYYNHYAFIAKHSLRCLAVANIMIKSRLAVQSEKFVCVSTVCLAPVTGLSRICINMQSAL